MSITATRYHDISCGHRVANHESKCRHLHGHNYRIHFTIRSHTGLDDLGRVLDFSVIKEKLCMWLEQFWDHKFLAWEADELMNSIHKAMLDQPAKDSSAFFESLVWLPFNPTAENMAEYLTLVIGPQQLAGSGCELVNVRIEETRKCSVDYSSDVSLDGGIEIAEWFGVDSGRGNHADSQT